MRFPGLALALGVAALWIPAPASAGSGAFQGGGIFVGGGGRAVNTAEIPFTVRGAVDVEFRGDPAAGCQGHGLCDLSGAIHWRPGRKGFLSLVDVVSGRRRSTLAFWFFTDEEAPSGEETQTFARVWRTAPDGSTVTCSDAVVSQDLSSFGESKGGFLDLGFAGAGSGGPRFLTRCGGPLDSELGRGLVERRLSVRAVRGGRREVDLRGERHVSGHGFVATVRSSVVLRLGEPDKGDQGPSDPFPAPPLRRRRKRTLEVTYRVESVDGALTTSFEGLPRTGLCEPLGACDSSGRSTFTPAGIGGTATVFARGSARLPHRAFRAAVGLAPGGGTPGITVLGSIEWHSRSGSVDEALTRADGTSCRDTAPVRDGYLGLSVVGRRANYLYSPDPAGDPLRTRCPGPTLADATARRVLASGSVRLRALGERRVILRLDRGAGFNGDGYHGRTSSTLSITLRRVSVRESIVTEPAY